MTDKELKKLGRAELLEILLTQTREVDSLKMQVEKMNNELKNREIAITKAGSIAEASLLLNGVFESAQKAAEQYLENIQKNEKLYENAQQEGEKKAEEMIAAAELQCNEMLTKTQAQCDDMLKQAKEQSQLCWVEVSKRIETITKSQESLKSILATVSENTKE